MANHYQPLTGRIDRRGRRNENDYSRPYIRENWLSRDGIMTMPRGTDRVVSTTISDLITWTGRYHSIETGVISPKSFIYTQDGKLWIIDNNLRTATEVQSGLSIDAYPKHWLYKVQTQTKLYLVDGINLYKHDGNNDNTFEKVDIEDTGGDSILPIDVIEHKDRLCLLSKAFIYISKNLDPDVFDDATDSIQIIVGSGKGQNFGFGKIPNNDTLYIFNTEGIFALYGDEISAVASTFEIRLVDSRRILAGRSLVAVENALVFLADDYNIWSFNGNTSQKLSHDEKLEDFVNRNRTALDKAVATYYNNYYMLSFVETGEATNNLEVFWDAFESKCEFVRGRNVSCYLYVDPTIEIPFQQFGRSDINMLMWADTGYNFDGEAIKTKLWTKDITVKKGRNVRFTAFYPEFEPKGARTIDIKYFLDGRLGDTTGDAQWEQSLQGEIRRLGAINIKNQSQFTDMVRPKISYAKGQSIAFYISIEAVDQRCDFKGVGMDYILKEMKNVKTVGG